MNSITTVDLARALSAVRRDEIAEALHRHPKPSGPLRRAVGLGLIRTGLRMLRTPLEALPTTERSPT